MADPDLKKNMPWSVKGVSKEAREVVKKAAAEQGITMGEWLSQVIRDDLGAGPDSETALEPVVRADPSAEPGTPLDGRAVEPPNGGISEAAKDQLRRGIADKIAESEKRILNVVEPLQEIIQEMAMRIELLENREPRAVDQPQSERIDGLPTYRKTGWDD